MKYEIPVNISGRFRIKIKNTETNEVKEYPWQNNLVLDRLYDEINIYTASYIGGTIAVGTGTSTPAATQTKLDNWIANSSGSSSIASSLVWTGPNYTTGVFNESSYEFTQGAVVGNISELGLGEFGVTNPDLTTRSLIKDGAGNPTTIAVTSNDILIVEYRIDFNWSHGVVTSTQTIDGVSTTVKMMPFAFGNLSLGNNNVDPEDFYFTEGGGDIEDPTINSNLLSMFVSNNSGTQSSSINSALNAISTNSPGVFATGGSSINGYDYTYSGGPSDLITSNGISHVAFTNKTSSMRPRLIIQYNPPLNKTELDNITVNATFKFVRPV